MCVEVSECACLVCVTGLNLCACQCVCDWLCVRTGLCMCWFYVRMCVCI